jgi:hypothetical protein
MLQDGRTHGYYVMGRRRAPHGIWLARLYQHGSRRCLLSGSVYDRNNEEAAWEALASLANFEPRPGQVKDYKSFPFFPEEFTSELAGVWDDISKAKRISWFADVSNLVILREA